MELSFSNLSQFAPYIVQLVPLAALAIGLVIGGLFGSGRSVAQLVVLRRVLERVKASREQSRAAAEELRGRLASATDGTATCVGGSYACDYGSVTVTRSRFEQGRGGHYYKSRAGRNVVVDNSFDDSKGRATNYMIDLPNGGGGEIRDNWFVQGADKENWSALIAVGAEGAQYSADGLVIEGNNARLAPGLGRNPAFVADWTGHDILIRGNTLGTGLKRYERR